jgi:sortase A
LGVGLLLILGTGLYYAYAYFSMGQLNESLEDTSSSVAVLQDTKEARGPNEVQSSTRIPAALPFWAMGPTSLNLSEGDEAPREGLAEEVVEGAPATRMIIPSIGVDSPVVEIGVVYEEGRWQWERPKHAVGHLEGTAQPGQVGNSVMSGHISSPSRGEGQVFKRLPEIKLGDVVIVYTPYRAYAYEVTAKKVVEPGELSVLDPTPDETMTLITCVPDLIYTHRLIVTAKRIGRAGGP